MTSYFKICEICGHKNDVSYLECESCSADISYISPITGMEEKGDTSTISSKIIHNKGDMGESRGSSTTVVERIKFVGREDNFEIHIPVKLETILGREGDLCNDYFNQSKFVSRRHATIRLNPSNYSITDHSINGTFVNGEILKRGQTIEIKIGDVIVLADIEFEVEALQEDVNGD